MLDIVITHYKESWEVGEKLFRMIALQRCVDFKEICVTVVNDGGDELPWENFNGLPYPVFQVNIPHGGVSAARNAGIEHSTGKWIMFCDFDDNFASAYSLREIINLLGTDDYDMLWCRIVAEDYLDGKEMLYYVPETQRFVFCHGKVYLRQFLINSGIRFREELVFNEDSCFNAEIIAKTPHERIGEIRTLIPIYVWVRRQNSVTNSGRVDEASYGHFKRNMIVTDEYPIEDHRRAGMIARTIYDTYYMVMGRRNSMQMRRRMLDEFAPWVMKRIKAFDLFNDENIEKIRHISKLELLDIDEIVPDDYETVSKWVKGIIDIYKKAGDGQ